MYVAECEVFACVTTLADTHQGHGEDCDIAANPLGWQLTAIHPILSYLKLTLTHTNTFTLWYRHVHHSVLSLYSHRLRHLHLFFLSYSSLSTFLFPTDTHTPGRSSTQNSFFSFIFSKCDIATDQHIFDTFFTFSLSTFLMTHIPSRDTLCPASTMPLKNNCVVSQMLTPRLRWSTHGPSTL